jgi:hypothetical protein
MMRKWIGFALAVAFLAALLLPTACGENRYDEYIKQFEKECKQFCGIIYGDCTESPDQGKINTCVDDCKAMGGLNDCAKGCQADYEDQMTEANVVESCYALGECLDPCFN